MQTLPCNMRETPRRGRKSTGLHLMIAETWLHRPASGIPIPIPAFRPPPSVVLASPAWRGRPHLRKQGITFSCRNLMDIMCMLIQTRNFKWTYRSTYTSERVTIYDDIAPEYLANHRPVTVAGID